MANPDPHLNDFNVGTMSYNGFTFPTLQDISVEVNRVPDESGLGTMWNEWTIGVEFFYYPTAETLRPMPSANNPFTPDGLSYAQLLATGQLENRMTDLCYDLRQRLLEPGQEFTLSNGGIADLQIGGDRGGDVNNGPTPGPVSFIPVIGAIGVFVKWSIKFCIEPTACGISELGLVSMNFSSSWEYGESNGNLMTRSVVGSVVTKNRRHDLANSNRASRNLTSRNGVYNNYVKPLLQALFPKPLGFKRERTFSLGSDYKTFNFTFTDTEIMSDVPYPQPILEMKIRQRISSNLEKGFSIWTCAFTGSVSVAKSRTQTVGFSTQKKLAWVAIGRMIYNRLQIAQGQFYMTDSFSFRRCKIILDDIDIDDAINENEFNFSLKYRLFADQRNIFSTSGMFQPLRLSGATWQNREDYFSQIGAFNTPISPFPLDIPPVIEVCGPNSVQAQAAEENTPTMDASSGGDTSNVSKTAPKEDSYLGFSNDYEIFELNASSVHTPIWDGASERRERQRADSEGFIPTSDYVGGSPSTIPKPVIHNPTARTYIVRMYGYAIRAGVPASPPNLVQYGGQPAYKIGIDKVKIKSITRGVAMDANQLATNIYGISWSKDYIIKGTLRDNEPALRLTDRDPANPTQVPSAIV